MTDELISFGEAREILLKSCLPLGFETVEITEALGRVTAEEVVARREVPGFPNAKMDGFAARLEDARKAQKQFIPVVGEIAAGDTETPEVPAGCAVRIMTGALVPGELDCVIKVEDCSVKNDKVKFDGLSSPESGQNVRGPDDDLVQGETVVESGTTLSPARLGSGILSGRSKVKVHTRPEVLIFSSGDELVEEPGADLAPGQIYDINLHTVSAVAESAGARVRRGGKLPDSRQRAVEKIRTHGKDWDVLVTSGGVSKGEHDLTTEVIEEIGGRIIYHGVAQKPGKPLALARLGEKIILMLPGNVVSALVNSHLHLRPALLKLSGLKNPGPEFRPARATEDFPTTGQRLTFFRGQLGQVDGENVVKPVSKSQGSHVLSSVAAANCLVRVEPENRVRAGEKVKVTPLQNKL